MKLTKGVQSGLVVAASAVTVAAAAYATAKLLHPPSTSSGLKTGYIGARAPRN